jgi:hypothetical protein
LVGEHNFVAVVVDEHALIERLEDAPDLVNPFFARRRLVSKNHKSPQAAAGLNPS